MYTGNVVLSSNFCYDCVYLFLLLVVSGLSCTSSQPYQIPTTNILSNRKNPYHFLRCHRYQIRHPNRLLNLFVVALRLNPSDAQKCMKLWRY
ncbi:hypothetical protein BKA69DRAFT_1057718 [Paraphysoderma sedebokerense]|nr:hypothetical protein BKA69DRAFT_1057718 [Paraphysoderma sedebokerense]